jgi:hypothetical protein
MYTWRIPSRFSICPTSRLAPYAAGVLTIAMLSTMAGAQSVKVAPDVITVDQATHTAKVQVTNTTGDTTTVDLALKASTPGAADAAKRDSLARFWSLSAWVTNMPATLTLAPHETRTVALDLAVPASLDAGEYSTYLVVQAKEAGAAGHVAIGGSGGGNQITIEGMGGMSMQGMTLVLNGNQVKVASKDDGGSTSSGNDAGGSSATAPFAATKIVYQAQGKQQKP